MKLKQVLAVLSIGISIGVLIGNKTEFEFNKAGDEGRITGVGGIFFKTPDPVATKDWYKENLGVVTDQYGSLFEWRQSNTPEMKAYTQWAPFSAKSTYFDGDYMINYRVDNMDALLKKMRENGVEIVDSVQTVSYGKFLHIRDINGLKVELWEPIEADSVMKQFARGGITKK